MCNLKVNTCQCLKECYFMFNQKISTLSFELLVWLLLHYNNNVTWLDSWVLISLSMENILLVVWCALVNFSFNYFLFLHDFFSVAVLAFVFFIDHLTCTIAIFTRSWRLSVHTRSKLLHPCYHAASFASCALFYSAFFSTLTIAIFANSFSIHCNFGLLTRVYFFQSDF